MDLKKYCEGAKGILFDFVGTIGTDGVHLSRVIWEGWQKAGVETTLPYFRETYEYAVDELERTRGILPQKDFSDSLRLRVNFQLQRMAHKNLLPADIVDQATDKVTTYCKDVIAENVKKAVPILESLSSRYSLALVGDLYGNLEATARQYGIEKYFKKILDTAEIADSKEESSKFNKIAENLGHSPKESIVVGDSYKDDILPALDGGFRAIWLKGEEWDGKEASVSYEPSIDKLAELAEITV